MDIRVKKTKRAIQKAFIELLREKPYEKITVREVAERAEINKTTFYAHYETLNALTAELEQQTIHLIMEQMDSAQQLLEEPEVFVRNLFALLQQAVDFLGVISTSHMNQFAQHLQTAILGQIKAEKIDIAQYESIGAILVFLVHGLIGLLSTDSQLAQQQLDNIAAFVAAGIRKIR